MNVAVDFLHRIPSATDGEIAALNLESMRCRAWARFKQDVSRPGLAETVLVCERLVAQFLGDLNALDRLDELTAHCKRTDDSFCTELVHAEVATAVHRFGDARSHLARATQLGAPCEALEHQSLTINQACGMELKAVLVARRRIAAVSGRLEDQVPLGAVLADLDRFAEADAVYQHAFYSYDGISPFPLAWVCFQLGVLWGELVPMPDPALAALWYRHAIAYLPGFVRARVHLAEIYASRHQPAEAEALLLPVLSSVDPEVQWRLSDVLAAQQRFGEADAQLEAARLGFDALLDRHPLAFADHTAEFYAGSGGDLQRASSLACANVENRPTRRAVRQALAIAARA